MCRLNRLGRSGVTQNFFFFKLSFKTYKKVSTRISEQQKGFSSPVPLLCPINRCTLGNYLSTSKHLFCNFSSDLLTIINFLAFPVWHHMSRRDRRCRRPHSSVYQSVTVSHKPLGGVKGRTAMFPDTDKWTSVAPAKTTTGRELTSAATLKNGNVVCLFYSLRVTWPRRFTGWKHILIMVRMRLFLKIKEGHSFPSVYLLYND